MTANHHERMFTDIDFGPGEVAAFIESHFDPILPPDQQVGVLREDMFSVSYDTGEVIDVGWYPNMDIHGCFIVQLVVDGNWDRPARRYDCASYKEAETKVGDLVRMVREQVRGTNSGSVAASPVGQAILPPHPSVP